MDDLAWLGTAVGLAAQALLSYGRIKHHDWAYIAGNWLAWLLMTVANYEHGAHQPILFSFVFCVIVTYGRLKRPVPDDAEF